MTTTISRAARRGEACSTCGRPAKIVRSTQTGEVADCREEHDPPTGTEDVSTEIAEIREELQALAEQIGRIAGSVGDDDFEELRVEHAATVAYLDRVEHLAGNGSVAATLPAR